jgi:hypothetical protein
MTPAPSLGVLARWLAERVRIVPGPLDTPCAIVGGFTTYPVIHSRRRRALRAGMTGQDAEQGRPR